jgi:hypothetical protein
MIKASFSEVFETHTRQPTFVKVPAREPQTSGKSSKETIPSTFIWNETSNSLTSSSKKRTCDINHFIDIFCPKCLNPLTLRLSGFHICSKPPTSDNDPTIATLYPHQCLENHLWLSRSLSLLEEVEWREVRVLLPRLGYSEVSIRSVLSNSVSCH